MQSEFAFRDGPRALWRSLAATFYTELHELVDFFGAKLFLRLFEPFMVVGVALCWHTLMSANPPYGTNRLLFLVTGYYPVHLLIEVASGFWMASKRGAHLRRYPVETMLDQVLVGAFIEAVIYIAAGVLDSPSSTPTSLRTLFRSTSAGWRSASSNASRSDLRSAFAMRSSSSTYRYGAPPGSPSAGP